MKFPAEKSWRRRGNRKRVHHDRKVQLAACSERRQRAMRRRIPKGRRERESGSVREVMTELRRRGSAVGHVRMRAMTVLTALFNCPLPGEGVAAGSEVPGTPVEIRPDRNVEIPGRPSRRRHRGQLAQQEGGGLCQPGAVEPRSRRPRSGGKEPQESNYARDLPGSFDKRQPGRSGGRPSFKD